MMPQIGIIFDEYPYTDNSFGMETVSYPIVIEGVWWLNSLVYSIDDIGKMCNIPDDELIFMKLKYGG